MADILQSFLAGAGSIFAGLKIGFTWFLMLSPFLIGVILFLYLSRFKHTLVMRRKTKDKTDVVTVTKFKINKKKGKPVEIQTLKGKFRLPIPPDIAVEITNKGKLYVECYMSEGGEATWLKVTSKVTTEKIKREELVHLTDKKGVLQMDEDGKPIYVKETKEVIEDIKLSRLKTEDKSFYFNRERILNEKYKQLNLWAFLNQHGGTLAFLIFIGMIFIFWGDIMAPAIEMAKANNNYNQAMLEKWDGVLDRVDALIEDRQKFETEQRYNITEPIVAPE